MKLFGVMALLVITATTLLLGQSKAQKAGGPSGKTEEEIQELHNKLIQAQLNSDIAALDRLWADDHIFTNPLGVVQTKAQRLAEIQSGGRKLELFSINDVQVRVYGDTAVVTSRAMLKGQRQGQDIIIIFWNSLWGEFISIPKEVIGMATTCEDKSRAVPKVIRSGV